MKELIRQSALAGILISLAGAIYINCANKIVGSLLFSIGLISVIVLVIGIALGISIRNGIKNKENNEEIDINDINEESK